MSNLTPPGAPPPYPTAIFPSMQDVNAVVQQDAPCRKCSYNLRGLTNGGRCPECGMPVGLSTLGDLLRYSDPTWLSRLAKGLGFILWGALVSIVVTLAGAVLFKGQPLQIWVLMIGSAMSLYGAWILTEPDPSGLGEAQYATPRKIVRVALLIGLSGNLLRGTTALMSIPSIASGMIQVLAGLTGLVHLVGEFAKFIYLEKLARRIPDDQLADRAKVIRWGYGTTSAVMIVFGLMAALLLPRAAATSGTSSMFVVLGCVGGLVSLTMLVFWVMSLFFYGGMRTLLTKQAEYANQIWGYAANTSAIPSSTDVTHVNNV